VHPERDQIADASFAGISGQSAASYDVLAGGSFGGSDGESKGLEGNISVSRVSNLLIMLIIMAGFDPAIRSSNPATPANFQIPGFRSIALRDSQQRG